MEAAKNTITWLWREQVGILCSNKISFEKILILRFSFYLAAL